MANIRKLAHQKYLIRVSKGTGSRRVFDNHTFHGSRADAKKKADEMQILIDGTDAQLARLTFETYFEFWLKAIRKKIAPRTLDGYDGSIRRYALEDLKVRRVGKIERHHIQAVYDACEKSPATIANLHAALNACFSWAVRRGAIRENPCKYTDRPKKKKPNIFVMDEAKAAKFIDAARPMPQGLVFEFALETGMRPEEYLALRWSDVRDTDVSVEQVVQYNRKGGGFYFGPTKTKGSRRRIPISQDLRRRLHRHRIDQHGHRLKIKATWFDHDLVFPNEIGRPQNLKNLTSRYFRPVVDVAFPPEKDDEGNVIAKHPLGSRLTLYSLRHTMATLLLVAGVNPKIVSERLGHSSVVLTLDTYSHVLPTIQADATNILDGILRKAV